MVHPGLSLLVGCLSLAQPGKAETPTESVRAARALAQTIDKHLAAGWAKAGVKPAALADDAEFMRRVYLDVAGRIPSVTEARHFLADQTPDRRERLVDRLLGGPRYAAHFTRYWRSLWLPEAGVNFETTFLVPGFDSWLRKQLADGRGYDQIVRDLVTMPMLTERDAQRILSLTGPDEGTPIGFYVAKQNRPEELGAATARLFLGVSLDCAQCHNHPCGDWTREQFWSFAAFFAGIESTQRGGLSIPTGEALDRRQVAIPNTERVVPAVFLDGGKPRFRDKTSARETLAEWLTSADNPYFARAAVNRVWGYFFGTGLVDPVDEMFTSEHPPSHPELLDELARAFAARRFDLRFLIRAITATRAYQLTSAGTDRAQGDPRLFARMPVRGLTADQIYDSVAQATGYQESGQGSSFAVFQAAPTLRSEFLARFATMTEKATQPNTSILHALTLMNGKLMADATSVERSDTLTAVADAPFLTTAARVEALYLAALSRRPRAEELTRLVRYVEGGATAGRPTAEGRTRRLADLFWALLNSGEFILNH